MIFSTFFSLHGLRADGSVEGTKELYNSPITGLRIRKSGTMNYFDSVLMTVLKEGEGCVHLIHCWKGTETCMVLSYLLLWGSALVRGFY